MNVRGFRGDEYCGHDEHEGDEQVLEHDAMMACISLRPSPFIVVSTRVRSRLGRQRTIGVTERRLSRLSVLARR